ncbi:type II toxin-antitoxin system HicB family antitoxin [Cronbergia sp. UHCC 0137]|uniref:type II toxin-antitoxin system HicB family antitoxin n=1 Tax=Cronbergia sp. UHCC 0137 TaxID=3110239 RepID=UPI002B20AEE1|nr:type II toxin-antitoxin system HicB family antitoxin [Cronbergia sp. UHCC 0137]MEA5616467.1 type II toxin-antitoxin system HicB family antitoxin [Cronbergia sp. UHCC 0137]
MKLKLLTNYIHTAMHKANYELLEDGIFYAEIPECKGVWANGDTLEICREELQDALEGWIILGLRLGHTLPILDGINLNFFNQEVP